MGTVNQQALLDQSAAEMAIRLPEIFGTGATIEDALLAMQADPDAYIDGQWGFIHGGAAVQAMQVAWIATGDINQVTTVQQQQIAFWYTRESIARCEKQDTSDHLNPLTWSEDSRLDYYVVIPFTDWYLSTLTP